MSQGDKIPFRTAYALGGKLMQTLRAAASDAAEQAAIDQLVEVGSMRRCREMIGDLDVLAPWPGGDHGLEDAPDVDAEHDPLFRVLCRLVDNPPEIKAKPGTLFDPPKPPPARRPELVLGSATKGLNPGFKSCEIELRPKLGEGGSVTPVGLNVFRATPASWGWKQLMTTGPGEFGEWFLWKWKQRYGIPPELQASIKGHLVDAGGRIVEVRDEAQAFVLCGIEFIDPRDRDRWMDWQKTSRELMR